MARIKFMTDSVCDIPRHLLEGTDIQVLPFPIIFEDKEYLDGVDFTPDEFYPMLLEAPKIPSHAQHTSFYFFDQFEAVWNDGYTDLIHTSINSKGSSTFQNAVQAREEFYKTYPEAKETFHIYLLDSLTYTMGYGWAVLEGVKMAKNGASAQEVVDYMQDWIDHVRVVIVPLDLRFAKKSGRISAAAAFMGEALGLKPLMVFEDGVSKALNKVRGEKAAIKALVELCQKERKEGTPYMIMRGNNLVQGQALVDACTEALGQAPEVYYPFGGAVAINAGPNMIGMVYRT